MAQTIKKHARKLPQKKALFMAIMHKGLTLATIFGLLATTGPTELRAQTGGAGGRPAPDNSSWERSAMGAITGFGNQMMQMMQASQAAQRAAAMMGQLQPKIIPARFFPQCRIAQADPNFPTNACSNVADPYSLQLAEGLVGLASNYNQFYEQLISPAQNSPYPVGLQCIEESKKQVEAQIGDKINSLTATIARIKKETQLFRDQNRSLTEDMRNLSDDLNGPKDDNRTLNNTNRANDLKNQFSDAACAEVMNDSLFSKGGGLRGMRDFFNTGSGAKPGLRTSAANLQRDIPVLKQHLETQMSRMIQEVRAQGVEDWTDQLDSQLTKSRRGGLTNFQGVGEAANAEVATFKAKLQKIKDELQQVSNGEFQIPKMDNHFQENIKGFASGAKSFFKKKFINGCVNGSNSTGVALTPDQILSGLRMSNNETGTTLNDFKIALTNILGTDAFIQDKLAQIRALEQQYGGAIKVEFIDSGAQKQLLSPFQLYKAQIANCEQMYSQDQTFSTSQKGGAALSGATSEKDKVERAQRYLEDARKLESAFIDKMIGTIKDKVLNCGENSTTRTGQCAGSTMDPGENTNFCINTAVRCADNIQKCYAKVEEKVKEKETLLKARADNYNKNIRGLIARQEGVLSMIKAQVVQDQEFLKRFFPGASYELKDDLFVGMPTMEDSEFGVQLIGGKQLDLKYLSEDLPAQLEKLKASLKEQQTKVTGTIDTYKREQEAALKKNQSDWNTLKTTCEAAAKGLRAKVTASNEAGAKTQAEADSKVGEFCQKYDNLRNSNPMAGCAGDFSPSKLQGEATRIVASLDASVSANLNEYGNLCAQYNNERTAGSTGSGSSSSMPLREMCDSAGTWGVAYTRLVTRVLSNIPPSDASKTDAIRAFLTGSGTKPDIANAAFSTTLDELKGIQIVTVDPVPQPPAVVAPTPVAAGIAPTDTTTGTVNDDYLSECRTKMGEVKTEADKTPPFRNVPFTAARLTRVSKCMAGDAAGAVATPAGTAPTTFPLRADTTLVMGDTGLGTSIPATPITALSTRTDAAKTSTGAIKTKLTGIKTCLDTLKNTPQFSACTNAASTAAQCQKLRELVASVELAQGKAERCETILGDMPARIAARTAATAPVAAATPTPTPAAPSSSDVCISLDAATRAAGNPTNTPCPTTPHTEAQACAQGRTAAVTAARATIPDSPYQLLTTNRKIANILESARTTTPAGVNPQLWSRIGERSSGACNAAMNGSRGGGDFAEMLRRFDANTIGGSGMVR